LLESDRSSASEIRIRRNPLQPRLRRRHNRHPDSPIVTGPASASACLNTLFPPVQRGLEVIVVGIGSSGGTDEIVRK